jgi:hypothetical protein
MTGVSPDDKWRHREAGPVVRPYAVTGGRTTPVDGALLDLLTVIVAARRTAAAEDIGPLTPEHRRLLSLCVRQITLADLGADIGLPLGVVRVLLADLMQLGAIRVVRQRPPDQLVGNDVLQEILNGLRAL